MAKRLLKPKTVLKKWEALCKKVKSDKTRRKAPGRKEARRHADMCGMKSILEVEIAAELDRLGVKWQYEPHEYKYHMCVNWCHDCDVKFQTYTPDFWLPKQKIYLECKGKMTLDTRKKMIAVKHHNPELEVKMIFGYAKNKLSTAKKATRYWQWAENENFDWSDKEVKKEWVT